MIAGRALSVAIVLISAMSLAIGLWGNLGVMTIVSAIALCFSIINAKYAPGCFRLALIVSVVLIVCTILMTTVLSYDTLVREGTMSNETWIHMAGIIQAVAILPITFMSYFVIAAFSNASYNWAVVTGLTTFIGLGILSIGYAMTYVFYTLDLNKGPSENYYVFFGLMVAVLVLVIFSICLHHVFRKNRYLITSKGLEVMP